MLKFLSQELRWHSLKYKKLMNERNYQQEKEAYQRWMFTLFFSLLNIMTFFLWIAGVGSPNPFTTMRIALNISRLASPLFLHIILKYYSNFVEETIIALISGSVVFYIEINRSIFSSMGSAEIFFYGILTESLCGCLIFF